MLDFIGYRGLLNWQADGQDLIVATDFAIDAAFRAKLAAQLHGTSAKLHFVHLLEESPGDVLLRAGVSVERYSTLQIMAATPRGHELGRALFRSLGRGDCGIVELPPERYVPSLPAAHQMLDVLCRANYAEQEAYSSRFFDALALGTSYRVAVTTPGARLVVEDARPWFQLGGRLVEGEQRILPGGEVAYTGSSINGSFCVDGAILPTPTGTDAWPTAVAIGQLSRCVARRPLTLFVEAGRLTHIEGGSEEVARLEQLLTLPHYRVLTEVGVSFNRACAQYIHDWSAPSNEGRPGVHLAIGGDPDPEDKGRNDHDQLVHIDLLAATTRVEVNGVLYLESTREEALRACA